MYPIILLETDMQIYSLYRKVSVYADFFIYNLNIDIDLTEL